jgi:peptidoglycan/LPS O-acetylase OafA/YrhL
MVFTVGAAMLLGTHENAWWVLVLLPMATLALGIACSLLSYHVLEKPFRRAKAKWEPSRAERPESRFSKSFEYDGKKGNIRNQTQC